MKTKKSTIKSKDEGYEDLYICLNDSQNKRKNLLLGMKDSLVMQEEYSRILEIRKNKAAILSEIKKGYENLNKNYQELRKSLPNVKNTINYTEKELAELESQVNMLKKDTKYNKEAITLDEEIINELSTSNKSLKEITKKPDPKKVEKAKPQVKKEEPKIQSASDIKQKVTKIDRIKNNLQVIESKLKNI
ncbi:MAG: hypothetical protein PF569_00780 [Candidatus Woesearchaeota archaeon]|jgi:chromosome segregation ATPase|nr:hypothetical protein [Candidatus Woesearchaeota archaeon]